MTGAQAADAVVIWRANGNCRAIGGKENASAAKIRQRSAVDVSALLIPSTCSAIPCVNTNLTGVRAVAVVLIRPNGNCCAVGGKRNALAAIITRRFAVDVSALLFPSTCSAIPCVNTNVTGGRAAAVVLIRPNGNCCAVGGKRNALAALIVLRFAVDVSALLFPSTCSAIPSVNSNVTGVRAVAVVPRRPNSNRRAVGGKGNAKAAMIVLRFAVDVSALLFPSTCSAIPCVNTNVTGVRAVAVVTTAPQ